MAEFKETTGKIIAQIYRGADRAIAKVPVLFDNRMPDVPGILQVGEEFFILTNRAPLTYEKCIKSVGEEIR